MTVKKALYLITAHLLFAHQAYGSNNSWVHHDFDTGMKKNEYNMHMLFAVTQNIVGVAGDTLYTFFKKRYEQLNPSVLPQSSTLKIPKIIHQIWLGSKAPEQFKKFNNTWIDHHVKNGWEYKLWTDKDVEALGLYNQDLYDSTTNYGMKSDIARLEIIYRYGGVYVDMDAESLNPLDPLHYLYDFYVGLQPLDSTFVQLGNTIFGAAPGHPVIKECITSMPSNWLKHKGAPQKTGPVHMTRVFFNSSKDDSGLKDIALPAIYFYPLGASETLAQYEKWYAQGALCVHWWAKSWMPKEYRRGTFRFIENDASTKSWND